MTYHRLSLLTVTLLAVVVLAAGGLGAEISEPDHIVYGTPTWYGEPVAEGTVSLVLDGGAAPIASFAIGSNRTLGAMFALRVPMDSVEPRRAGTARTGDSANLFIDDHLAGSVVIGERGTAQLRDADPENAEVTPALSIGDVAVSEPDEGTVDAVFTVSLSVATEDPVTVDWVTEDGSATGGVACGGGVDFVARSGTATINPGDLGVTVTIAVCGEALEESDETFFVNLLNPSNAALLDPQGRGTIVDDDTPPSLSVNNVTVTEPPSGSVVASFRVSLTRPWDEAVQFGYATLPDTASAGLDYLSTSGTGSIQAGSLETTVTVEVLADTLNEEDETFLLQLSAPVNASILDGVGQCIIVDGAQFLLYVETQKDGIAGVDGLAGAFAVVVSPDLAHVYAAGRSEDALAVFARDPVSGELSFIRAYTPTDFQNRYTEAFVGLDGPEAVAVSPDGAHVYVAAHNDDAVAVFSRDPASGLLELLEVEADGVNDLSDPGPTVNGLDGAADLALTPDGHSLYAAGSSDSSVAVFRRDPDPASPTYGRLTFSEVELDGVDDPSDLGGLVDGLHLAVAVAVSPDGESLYVAGPGDNAVAVFDRDADPSSGALGRLSFVQVQKDGVSGVDGLAGAAALALSSDGAHLYVAGQSDNGLAAFGRAIDGSLTFVEAIRTGSGGVVGLTGAGAVATSQDGGYVYATGALDDALVVLERAADPGDPTSFGRLSFVEVKRDGVGGVDGLFGAGAIAVSADDLSVYTTGGLESAVTAFTRDLTAPADPVVESTSHVPGVWSNLAVVSVSWSGAQDNLSGAGVAGYSFLFDGEAATVPDGTIDLAHTVDPHQVSSAPLAEGFRHFHLRTCDHAGNCSAGVHLGELRIDLSPPLTPTGVASLSHVVGVPTADATIDMAWTTATDVGSPPSGLKGYSYTFNHSAAPTCNLELDLSAAATAVTGPTLAAGLWYFHLCAQDVAGNWGPAAIAGPYEVIDDAVPPRVLAVGSVAQAPGGGLDDGELVANAISQLTVAFSKAMNDPVGDVEPLDVTNPANYLLAAAGDDGVVTSDACLGADAADVAIPVTRVTYDDVALVATLEIDAPRALPMGLDGLSLCGTTLTDLNGNLLDGDGDGAGGDSFLVRFRVTRTNRTLNPNLDANLDDWSLSSPSSTTWDLGDADDAPTSGSVVVSRAAGGPTEYSVSQCVDLDGLDGPPFFVSGMVRIEETLGGDPGAATAAGRVVFRDGLACTGNPVGSEVTTNQVQDDTGDLWLPLAAELATMPASAVSAVVSFTITLPPGEDFPLLAWFDQLLFQHADQTPPTDPTVTSPSHSAGGWSNLPVIAIEWSGAVDGGAGVAGYSLLFDSAAGTVPDTTLEVTGGGGSYSTSSPTLVDGVHFFHLRTCDHADNCSAGVHAGGFGIDTVPPGNPTGLASTSHAVGVPAPVSVVDMAWTPAMDSPPAPSGIAGYSVSFDQVVGGEPDYVVDVPGAATGASSEPLPNGTYYFHLRTRDLAGNWGAVVTTGPYVIFDNLPPTVLAVSSVAAPHGGWLDPGEITGAAITKLVATLSEPVQDPPGDTILDDVTNPSNYRVVGAGSDGQLSTVSCLSVLGDDLLFPITSVDYDLASDQAAAALGTTSLPAGLYRFMLCGSTSIVDPAGNPLDGNGDGIGGDDFRRDFTVTGSNLLANPNFDDGLSGWSAITVPPSGFSHAFIDADGSLFSGSAEISNLSGAGAVHELRQCVPVSASADGYEAVVLVRVDAAAGGLPWAEAEIRLYGQPGCSGSVLDSAFSDAVVGQTLGTWVSLHSGLAGLPPTATSARVVLRAGVDADPPSEFVTNFDVARFQELDVLFADGFESGSTDGWSGVQP